MELFMSDKTSLHYYVNMPGNTFRHTLFHYYQKHWDRPDGSILPHHSAVPGSCFLDLAFP